MSVRHHKGGLKAALVISPILQYSPFASTALIQPLDGTSDSFSSANPAVSMTAMGRQLPRRPWDQRGARHLITDTEARGRRGRDGPMSLIK